MTPIDPPPGLLDKVREATDAVRDAHEFYASHTAAGSVYGCTGCDARFPDWHGHAPHVADFVDRAAWDAVAEGLGLKWQSVGLDAGFAGEPTRYERRLVSKWEPQP